MTEQTVTYELDGDIALIGLDRQDKRNAMNGDLFRQLGEAANRAQREARAGVIFGHGNNFSAGLDLKYAITEMRGRDPIHADAGHGRPFDVIARGGIPFVAALHGAVVGAGFELAAATHIRVADASAFFALPEGQRGIFVGGGGSVRIQRLIGYGLMADMMLSGRALTATEAKAVGAVQYTVVDEEPARDKAIAIARRIAENAPRSNWAIVNALPRIADMPQEEGLYVEMLTAQFVANAPESRERITDFLEKRAKPLERGSD